MNHYLKIKPLSVNGAFKGKKYKTKDYQLYEKEILFRLPPLPKSFTLPEMIKLSFTFGFRNKSADIDNPVKLFVDILQKKYGFNDAQVYKLQVQKKIVPKGEEYICFTISNCLPF